MMPSVGKMEAVLAVARHGGFRAAARDLGLSFSLHTDDPGAFECTMASEHQLASQAAQNDARGLWNAC